MQTLSQHLFLSLEDWKEWLNQPHLSLQIHPETLQRLEETRRFVDYLLKNQIKVYGLTTGFADLRNTSIASQQAAALSKNLIYSHDAGIGEPLPLSVTWGAMVLRAHSLAKGYSGFTPEALSTLTQMIAHRIVPLIPSSGSLGASGDLAFLARLGRAMMGEEVAVSYQQTTMSAKQALQTAGITPFTPQAKEGLALTNGTPFMASMLSIAYLQELRCLDHLLNLTGLFLNAVGTVGGAFYDSLQQVRGQTGQSFVAQRLKERLPKASLSFQEVQNDYCIRCLPQIYGPRFAMILEQRAKIEQELNAVTDNPLIFREEEISIDFTPKDLFSFEGKSWGVVSGGNFHGENLTTIADAIALSNAKIALTIERQITYLMNPFRNKEILPTYLIANELERGVRSGFMITQYTANALTHKICLLAQPAGLSNITSANESEDIVSYGATACHKLLEQIALLEELLAIYLLTTTQAYSLQRPLISEKNPCIEHVFQSIQEEIEFPREQEEPFDMLYAKAQKLLQKESLGTTSSIWTSWERFQQP